MVFAIQKLQKISTQKHEKAARQQGGFLFRENSSNGGKTIRTFWRNTMFAQDQCQAKFYLI